MKLFIKVHGNIMSRSKDDSVCIVKVQAKLRACDKMPIKRQYLMLNRELGIVHN